MICGGNSPIGAAVGFEALKPRVAIEGGKAEHPRLAVLVLDRLENIDRALDERAAEREARRPRLDASELTGTPSDPRLEVLHGDMPGIPRPLRLDRRHCTHRQPELRCERGATNLDHTHGVDRQLDRILAR